MKIVVWVIVIFITLFAACENSLNDGGDSGEIPEASGEKTTIKFNNDRGVCSVIVYSDFQRGDASIIATIKAGSSPEVNWGTFGGENTFYFSYRFVVPGLEGITFMYTAPVGKDRTTMRITAGARNLVIIPTLEEALQDEAGVSQPDTLLSPKSYIVIRNDSSYSFRLAQNSGIITPENISGMAAGSPVVNSGDRAAYNIAPSRIISYKISCNARDIAFPDTPEIAVGCIMFYSFDGNVISCTDTKTITQANIGDIPDVVMPVLSPGLYKGNTAAGAERIGYQNLSEALQYIGENAVSGDNYYIVLGADESDGGGYGYTLRGRYNYENQQYERLNITLLSDGPERTITVSSYYGFIIEHDATLTLERNVTIRGTTRNRSSRLISVFGALVMNGGGICGNIGSGEGGGGVYVGGVFTMNGGTISGNTVSGTEDPWYGMSETAFGGGVHVEGTFTMNSGIISGNIVSSLAICYGGGVYVGNGGTFTMNGGTISGNTASGEKDPWYGNTPDASGGGVYVDGVFTMNGGTISGNTALSQVNKIVGGNTRGGGVYIGSDGIFTKQWGGGWVYGSNAAIPVFKNTANGHGDAVGYYQGKERNATIIANELFDSRMDIGWD